MWEGCDEVENDVGRFECVRHVLSPLPDGMSVSGDDDDDEDDDEDDDDRFVEPLSSLSRILPLSVCIFA